MIEKRKKQRMLEAGEKLGPRGGGGNPHRFPDLKQRVATVNPNDRLAPRTDQAPDSAAK